MVGKSTNLEICNSSEFIPSLDWQPRVGVSVRVIQTNTSRQQEAPLIIICNGQVCILEQFNITKDSILFQDHEGIILSIERTFIILFLTVVL